MTNQKSQTLIWLFSFTILPLYSVIKHRQLNSMIMRCYCDVIRDLTEALRDILFDNFIGFGQFRFIAMKSQWVLIKDPSLRSG